MCAMCSKVSYNRRGSRRDKGVCLRYGFKIISRARVYWSRVCDSGNITIHNNRLSTSISAGGTLKMIREMKLAMTWNFWKLFLTGKLG